MFLAVCQVANALKNSKGTPSSVGGLNTRGRKVLQISPFNSETVRARVTVGSIRVSSNDLEWPREAGPEGSKLSADLHNYAWLVWPRMTQFGLVTEVGRSIFLGVSHVSCCFYHFPRHIAWYYWWKSQFFPTPNLKGLDVCGLMQINVYLMSSCRGWGEPRQKCPTVLEQMEFGLYSADTKLGHRVTVFPGAQSDLVIICLAVTREEARWQRTWARSLHSERK